jgi:hypothetical protein
VFESYTPSIGSGLSTTAGAALAARAIYGGGTGYDISFCRLVKLVGAASWSSGRAKGVIATLLLREPADQPLSHALPVAWRVQNDRFRLSLLEVDFEALAP